MRPHIPNPQSATRRIPCCSPTLETPEETVPQLEAALEAAPDLTQTRWRLAHAYWDAGDRLAASRTLAGATIWPHNLKELRFAGRVFLETDRMRSLEVFEEIAFQFPRDLDAREQLAELCIEFDRPDESLEHARAARAIRTSPLPIEIAGADARQAGLRLQIRQAIATRLRSTRAEAITAALVLHLLAILILALWIIRGPGPPELIPFQVAPEIGHKPPPPDPELVESVQQKPPVPVQPHPPELVSTIAPMPISIEDPGTPEFESKSESDFGAPLGGGSGKGGGSRNGDGGNGGGGVEFFGKRSQAERVVFIVDFSSSMNKGQRLQRLKKELYKALASLSEGMLFNIIYYSDLPWIGDAWEESARTRPVPDQVRWRVASETAIRVTTVEITKMRAAGMTYWTPPLKLALAMDPKPDLIWLLSDGDAVDRRSLVKKLDRLVPEGVRINTIGMELGGSPFQSLVDIAAKTGGEFSIVMRGISYSGEEALRFTNDVFGQAEN